MMTRMTISYKMFLGPLPKFLQGRCVPNHPRNRALSVDVVSDRDKTFGSGILRMGRETRRLPQAATACPPEYTALPMDLHPYWFRDTR